MSRNRNVASASLSKATAKIWRMDMRFEFQVEAPIDHVEYVLQCVGEYTTWNSAARWRDGELLWTVHSPVSGDREYTAVVSSTLAATTIGLYRGPFASFRFHIETREAGRRCTDVSIAAWCAPSAALFSKRFALRNQLQTIGHDLCQRARWLQNAPDSHFSSSPPRDAFPPAARTAASLEQLQEVSRELEGGVLAVEGATSCCLLDLAGRRFARTSRAADLQQLILFGRWQEFDDVMCEGDDVIIVPSADAARVRIRARMPAVS
jgi:hypothetical protein